MTTGRFASGYAGARGMDRALAGMVAFAVVAGALVALWLGVAVAQGAAIPSPTIATFDVVPPPVPAPEPVSLPEPAGAAAPPALRATPKPIAAPPPKVPVETVPVPPVAGDGDEASAGAADLPGPGTGASGVGAGLGSGGGGNGTGGGMAARATRIRGGINIRDFPRAQLAAHATRSLLLHLSVSAEGRVTDCAVARSSGNDALDAITCRLAKRRFRYEPARDAAGRAVPDVAGWRQDWWEDR